MTILIPAWVDGVLHPVEKLEAHQKGLRHKAISVFAFSQGNILLQQRALEKYHSPGQWANTCCTHPNWGEDTHTAAHRRMAEELNLSGLTLRYVDQIEYRAEVGNGLIEHEVVDCFIAICDTPPLIHPNPSEVMDYTWIDPTTLKHRITATPQNYTKWLQIYVQDHFEALFQSGCEMSTS